MWRQWREVSEPRGGDPRGMTPATGYTFGSRATESVLLIPLAHPARDFVPDPDRGSAPAPLFGCIGLASGERSHVRTRVRLRTFCRSRPPTLLGASPLTPTGALPRAPLSRVGSVDRGDLDLDRGLGGGAPVRDVDDGVGGRDRPTLSVARGYEREDRRVRQGQCLRRNGVRAKRRARSRGEATSTGGVRTERIGDTRSGYRAPRSGGRPADGIPRGLNR